MSLEERTLVVRNIDGDKLTADLLEELFANFGPVVKIVLRKSFAFIEYTRKDSVAYALAMMEGVTLYGHQLRLCPKLESERFYHKYRDMLDNFDKRIVEDPSFADNFLTADHIKEKNSLISTLKSSSSKFDSINKRVRQYTRHCLPNSTFNPLLGKDFLNSNSRYNGPPTNHGHGGGGGSNRSHNNNNSYHNSAQPSRHYQQQNDERYNHHHDSRRNHSYSDLNIYNNYNDDNNNRHSQQHRHSGNGGGGNSRYQDYHQPSSSSSPYPPQGYSHYDNAYPPPPEHERERRHSDYDYRPQDSSYPEPPPQQLRYNQQQQYHNRY